MLQEGLRIILKRNTDTLTDTGPILTQRAELANLVQYENNMAVGLIYTCKPGHSCIQKPLTIHIPLWRKTQAECFKVFWRELRRCRENSLKNNTEWKGPALKTTFLVSLLRNRVEDGPVEFN
uniref:Uncharacterized protein n=1 Tax=Sphaeramia orbicularis TaxID=375764 RepID=A0A673CDB3_9TELE